MVSAELVQPAKIYKIEPEFKHFKMSLVCQCEGKNNPCPEPAPSIPTSEKSSQVGSVFAKTWIMMVNMDKNVLL